MFDYFMGNQFNGHPATAVEYRKAITVIVVGQRAIAFQRAFSNHLCDYISGKK